MTITLTRSYFVSNFYFSSFRVIISDGNYKLINFIMEEENKNISVDNPSTVSNKKLYISIALIIAVLAVIYIFSSKNTIAPGLNVDEETNGNVTLTTENGTITIGENSLPTNWPSDVSIYSNATIQYSGQVNSDDGASGLSVTLITTDSVQAVSSFYNSELSKNGWVVSQIAAMGDAAVISGNKDSRNVAIFIGRTEDNQTAITISISTN